eukprot:460306-Pleurochrysis_carterae.AAC.2
MSKVHELVWAQVRAHRAAMMLMRIGVPSTPSHRWIRAASPSSSITCLSRAFFPRTARRRLCASRTPTSRCSTSRPTLTRCDAALRCASARVTLLLLQVPIPAQRYCEAVVPAATASLQLRCSFASRSSGEPCPSRATCVAACCACASWLLSPSARHLAGVLVTKS